MRPEHWIYTIPLRLRSLFRRREADLELDDELRDHVEQKTEEYVTKGLAVEEARRQALLEMGGIEKRKEECRDTRRVNWIQGLIQDLHFGVRMLRKSPGFAVVAVLTLALGIGANTAVFSILDAALFSSSYSQPNRIVYAGTISLFTRHLLASDQPMALNVIYESWDRRNHSFSAMAAYDMTPVTLTGMGSPEMLHGADVTSGFFRVLGVQPVLGRTFHSGESRQSGTVILSNQLWRDRFNSNPEVIGQTIRLDDQLYTIVGIMPASFEFPRDPGFGGSATLRALPAGEGMPEPDVLLPKDLSNVSINANSFGIIESLGRLKPGISLEKARADLEVISQQDANESTGFVRKFLTSSRVVLVPLRERLIGNAQTALLALWGAVGFLLLIACVNVANLTLARGLARGREIAVRVALGAYRRRVARQLFTENLLLAALGAVAGLALAYGAVVLVRELGPAGLPRLRDASIDLPVLAFTALLAALAGVLAGLAPVRTAWRLPVVEVLKEGTRSSSGRGQRRFRNALMVAEIAMALVLAIGSGLLVRSFLQITAIDLGLNPHNLLTAEVADPPREFGPNAESLNLAAERNLADSLIERVAHLPGVRSAALTNLLPMSGFMMTGGFQVKGRSTISPDLTSTEIVEGVGPGYFQTMGIPLIAGREFEPRDMATTAQVVIVNETLARTYLFPGNPIGQELENRLGAVRIVGVVGDIRQAGLLNPPMPTVYLPYDHSPASLCLVIHTTGDPLALVASLRDQVQSIDKQLPVFDIATMDERLSKMEAGRRFEMIVLGIFAFVALLLAALGVYGVISYSVSQQTREIGIRMALGAEKSVVMRSVVGKALTLALIGVGIGAAGALALTRYLESLLYHIRPDDPLTFGLAAVVLLAAALLAAFLPGRRAMRLDPMVALRYE